MRGVYTASISISGINSARTLMYITAPSNKIVEIISATVSNKSNETNEQIQISFQRVSSLGSPTATTITPALHEAGDQAAASTVKGNVTASEPTYSSDSEMGNEGVSSLGGWYYSPSPEERPIIPGAGTLGLRLLTSPSAFDCVCRISFREVG